MPKYRSILFVFFVTASALGGSHDGQPMVPRRPESPVECREPVDFHGQKPQLEGKLSPFWSRELIGADLVADDLEKEALSPVPVGIIDGGFYLDALTGKFSPRFEAARKLPGFKLEEAGHGTRVANVFLGKRPYGIAVKAELDQLATNSYTSFYLQSSAQMKKAGVKVVNISQGMREVRAVEEAMKEMSTGAIVVAAAGNSYPFPMERPLRTLDGIVVGSISPWGLMTASTQEDPNVTILAPSDNYQLAPDGADGSLGRIGQTSGATPLVSGTVANALAIVPDLSLAEIKTLLTRTAQQTGNAGQRPRRTGAGTLNALRFIETVKRLRGVSAAERMRRLAQDSLFDFREEARVLREQGEGLLKAASCDRQREGIKLLRRSFLLDGNEPARALVASALHAAGLSANAAFYQSMMPGDFENYVQESLKSPDPDIRKAAVRSIAWLDRKGPFLEVAFSDKEPSVRRGALAVAANMGADGVPYLARARKDSDEGIRGDSLKAARLIGAPAITFAKRVYENEPPFSDDSEKALFAMGLEALPVAEKLMDLPGNGRRSLAAKLAGGFGKQGQGILQRAVRDPDAFVREAAATSLYALGPDAVPLLAALLDEKEISVMRNTVWTMARLWGDGVPLAPLGQRGVALIDRFQSQLNGYEKNDREYQEILRRVKAQMAATVSVR